MNKIFPLPDYLKSLIIEIYQTIEIDNFILYGGTPTNLLLDRNTPVHDLDIAIKGIDESNISACRERLKRKKFKIVEPCQEYFIYIDKKVILLYAENDKWFLDIGFLDNPELVGQFDAETLYCRYPELDCVDKFNALEAIRQKTLKPVRGLENENPYMLTKRFLHLCAKYNMSLVNNHSHESIILELKHRIKNWEPISQTKPREYVSCLSSVFKSILKSRNRMNFIKELGETNILEVMFPELDKAIKKIANSNNQIYQRLSQIKTQYDLIILFDEFLKSEDKESFKNKVKMLQIRHWDKHDIEVAKFFNKNSNFEDKIKN